MRTVTAMTRFVLSSTMAVIVHSAVTVNANFFTRLTNFREDAAKAKWENRTDNSPPSAVSSVQGSQAAVGNVVSFVDGVPMARLSNNNHIPLVGLGVGNMEHRLITKMIQEAIQDDKKTRLIDTAKASENEDLVAIGIRSGVHRMQRDEPIQVHVVTKVWYTHLGYERTKYAVEESLEELKPAIDDPKVDLKVHVLLHWPRCFDNIPWMNCEQEEKELPDHVRELGPDPGADPDQAWKESWKALEDVYLSDDYPWIASIGVSNFHVEDIEAMDSFARIHPHMTQVNLWNLLYDPDLVEYCNKHRIHVQAYNALGGTVSSNTERNSHPKALHHVQQIMYDLQRQMDGKEVTPAQVILAWLIQHGVSVIPRTSRQDRLKENSPVALANLPALSDHQVETMAHATEAYLSGEDLKKDIYATATFYAKTKDMVLYWMGHDGQDVRLAIIRKGQKFEETTYPNHIYRTYLATNKDVYTDHQIDVNFGEHKDIHVEL